jgi:hypothetical protein
MIKGEEEYVVEAIRAHQYQWHKLQYLIKWKGYPESDNTWKPIDNMQAPQLIRKYYEVHPLGDKRVTEQARTTSSPPFTPQPIWLLKSDHQSTFESVETVVTALAAMIAAAAKVAGLPTPSTPMQPP